MASVAGRGRKLRDHIFNLQHKAQSGLEVETELRKQSKPEWHSSLRKAPPPKESPKGKANSELSVQIADLTGNILYPNHRKVQPDFAYFRFGLSIFTHEILH